MLRQAGMRESQEKTDLGQSADVVKRRRRPRLAVLDKDYNVVAAEEQALELLTQAFGASVVSNGCAPLELQSSLAKLASQNDSGNESEAIDVIVRNGVVVQTVLLIGDEGLRYSLLVGPKAERETLERARERFGFTQREAEVLSLIVRGYRGSEIAEQLNITLATVTDHFNSLARKTDARNRSEMLAKVFGT